ncbi:DUF625-domain-containing protein, partial [Testicularia cyperi]
ASQADAMSLSAVSLPASFDQSHLPEIPDEVLPHALDPFATAAGVTGAPGPSVGTELSSGTIGVGPLNTAAPLPSMLNSTAIALEEDASGDLSTSSNEALTLTSTVSRGNYHQCGSARRVKVYELQGETWFDRGTGYCAGVYDETVDEALLVARREEKCQFLDGIDVAADAEALQGDTLANGSIASGLSAEGSNVAATDGGQATGQAQACQFVVVVSENLESEDILLASKVVKEEVYQRQQDTLVVWTEPTGVDMALSFQEAEGCNEVWEFLTEVQKHFMGLAEEALTDSPPTTPNPQSPTGVLGMSGSGLGMESLLDGMGCFVGLPDPKLGTLDKIDAMLKDATSRGPLMREKLTAWLMESHYIRKLVPVFHDLEELEALPALHMLCVIMQTILLLNDSFVFEFILQDDVFLGVIGMLEYDPEFPRLKANYREHLSQRAKFKQVVEIGDPMIVAKIHQTYRLLYLKDVVLARVVDDPTVSILNSFIFFHQSDIVQYCYQNEAFLGQLFSMLTDPDESDERRSEGILFLQQLCAMSKHIQLPSRIALYRTLVECGLLNVLQHALRRLDPPARNAAAEILMTIIEYDANSVRSHVVTQVDQSTRPLISMMIDMLHEERDPGLKTQIAEAMRIIFDVGSEGGPMATQVQVLSVQGLHKAKPDPERFLTMIYESEIGRLCSPFNSLPDFRVLSKGEKLSPHPRHRSALYGHLCDLLCHMIAHHSFRSQYFVLTSEVSKKVGSLLHSREKHVRLSALRFFKYCLASNNQFTNRHFIKIELFSTILDLIEAEGERNNLVSSACLDFFEHLKRENMKTLISHCMERYGSRMRQLAQSPQIGTCFAALIQQWERNQEPSASGTTAAAETAEISQREAQQTATVAAGEKARQRRGANRTTMDASEEDKDEDAYFQSGDATNTAADVDVLPTSGGLVPYGEEEEEEAEENEEQTAEDGVKSRIPEKRPRDEEDDESEDQLSRLAKRKSGRMSKNKSKAATGGKTVEDKSLNASPQQSPSSGGGFIRSVANTISSTFGVGSPNGNGGGGGNGTSRGKKDGVSRSPSPKGTRTKPGDDDSASAPPKNAAGVKKISLGLTGASKRMA